MPLRGPEKAQEVALAISEYPPPLAQGARPRAPEPICRLNEARALSAAPKGTCTPGKAQR